MNTGLERGKGENGSFLLLRKVHENLKVFVRAKRVKFPLGLQIKKPLIQRFFKFITPKNKSLSGPKCYVIIIHVNLLIIMDIKSSVIYFLTGGIVTLLIVALEESGFSTWSGIAALMPVFTLVSYIFIGGNKGGIAVSEHAKFVLLGTILSWIPYMLAVIYLAPQIGAYKSIAVGMVIFIVCALIFVLIANRYGLS